MRSTVARTSQARPICRSALAACAPLERRMLLSLAPAGAEFRVNTFTTGQQAFAAVASDADGDFVVVWDGNGSGDGNGVVAQRYNAAGVAQGTNFLVNTSTLFSQSDASVAVDADGDFVIAWENRMSATATDYDIFARRYNAAAGAQGGEFRLNTFSPSDQRDASVAIDASGNFVIAWQSIGQEGGSNRGIYAQRYNAAGVAQGGELHVNTITTANQVDPAAAMDASGDFVIVWASGSDNGIHAQRFDSAGTTVGSEFHVNSATTDSGQRASVAMDASGDFVVIWNGTNILARRFDSADVAQGLPFAAITFTTGFPVFSSVAMDADGDFLVTGEKDGPDSSSYGVFGQSFNAAGVPQGSEFLVNTFTTNRQRVPAVTMDSDGDAVVAWQSLNQDNTNSYGVYAQRYDESNPDTAAPAVGGVFGNGVSIAPGGTLGDDTFRLVLTFSENMSVAGGTSGPNSVTNPANYALMKNGVDVSSQISSVSFFSFNPATRRCEATLTFLAFSSLQRGSYVVTARDTLRALSGNALDGNFDGAAGGDFTRAFSIAFPVPAGQEFRANQFTSLNQSTPALAREANGDFVIAWQSEGQDGSGEGIFARRYNAAGAALGGEFRVNSFTTNAQSDPAVAMDALGNFVVTWRSFGQDGSNHGIYAQRYSFAGQAEGSEFRVNTHTTSSQEAPAVAMDASGDFVVAWESYGQDGSEEGVYAQRYNASGAAQGGEFRVNTNTVGGQNLPSVAMDNDGDFVVVWNNDVFYGGVRDGQRYNAAGVAQGAPFF